MRKADIIPNQTSTHRTYLETITQIKYAKCIIYWGLRHQNLLKTPILAPVLYPKI